jgi:hypothetical protein
LLIALFQAPADVEVFSQRVGHQISQNDVKAAARWLALRAK